MTSSPDQTASLRAAISHAGFYPALLASAVTAPLGAEPVTAFLVHQDTAFLDAHAGSEPGMEMLRHASVLALTPTRLIASHTDEYQPPGGGAPPRTETITDAISLARVTVTISQSVPDPASYDPATTIADDVAITASWHSRWRGEGGQDHCDDHDCQELHAYLTLTADDLVVQVSRAAHGPAAITSALSFATALATAAGPRP